MVRCQADGESLVAGGGEPAHALDEFIGRSRRGQVADQRGGEEALLLGSRPDEVALVECEVTGVRGLEPLVETAVLGHGRSQRLGHAPLRDPSMTPWKKERASGPASARARGLSAGSPSSRTEPIVKAVL